MAGLILLILGIAVAASTLVVGVNYTNPQSYLGTNYGALVADSFQSISNAFIKATAPAPASPAYSALPAHALSYYTLSPPVPLSTSVAPDGGLAALFTPTFLPQIPGTPDGYMWVYGPAGAVAGDTHWICLQPIPGYSAGHAAQVARAFAQTQSRFGTNLLIGSTCGIGLPGGTGSTATLNLRAWHT